MRIKFKKGVTPEDIASLFTKIVNDRGNLIGAVNIYVQEFDESSNMVCEDDYMEIKPTDYGKSRYEEYVADLRRSKLRVV